MATPSTQQVVVYEPSAVSAAFMPVMAMDQAITRYNAVLTFTQQIMKQGKDYGIIPGVEKPSLLKPGAEKLCSFFGLTPRFIVVKETEQWTGEEPFFYYWYKCQLWRGDTLIAEADGSCNSRESKYRYRWVQEEQIPEGVDRKRLVSRGGRISEFVFAIDKAETTGKYGKPPAYWKQFKDAIEAGTAQQVQKRMKDRTNPAWEIDSTVYRLPNPDIADQVNTVQKMAQKRSLIAVTLIACNASEYYTQDLEDREGIELDHQPAATAPKPAAAQTVDSKPTVGQQDPLPSGRPVPEELVKIFEKMDDPRYANIDANSVLRLMEDRLCKKFGTVRGVEIYKEVTGEFAERFPTPEAQTVPRFKDMVVDLLEALTRPQPDPGPASTFGELDPVQE